MKKAFIALAFVAATLLTVSCKKDNVAFSIKATINNYTHDTKVYVDDDNFSCWATGDEVKINNITGSIASTTNGGHHGTINSESEVEPTFYAVYPASAVTSQSVTASGTTIHLPSMQKCIVEGGHQVVNAIMAAQGETELDFYNLCALLKVKVPATLHVTDIYVTTNTQSGDASTPSGIRLWGNGTVTFNDNGARPTLSALTRTQPSASTPLDGGDTVYLHVIDLTSDGVYYITVPKVENTNFKVWVNYKVEGSDQNYFYCATKQQSGNTNCLNANEIGFVNFADIVPPTPSNPDPNDFIPGIYSISSTEKVNFAKGNLVFDVTTAGNNGHNYSWSFNTTQYNTVGYNIVMNGNEPQRGTSEFSKMSVNNGVFPNNNGYGSLGPDNYYDWGNYINEVTPSISEDNLWFTLSRTEWAYLLYTRGVSYARFAKVQVEGANGLLLFPDEFLWPNDNLTQPTALNVASAAFTQINYTAAQFSELEEAGCVFLRANGYVEHNGHNPTHANQTYGYYWTRDFDGNQTHSYLYFDNSSISPNDNNATVHAGYALCIRVARRAE